MTVSTRIEYSLIIAIELPGGMGNHRLRHVFDKLTTANDVASWYKQQPGTKFVGLTQVNIAETYKALMPPS